MLLYIFLPMCYHFFLFIFCKIFLILFFRLSLEYFLNNQVFNSNSSFGFIKFILAPLERGRGGANPGGAGRVSAPDGGRGGLPSCALGEDRKSTRLNSSHL